MVMVLLLRRGFLSERAGPSRSSGLLERILKRFLFNKGLALLLSENLLFLLDGGLRWQPRLPA